VAARTFKYSRLRQWRPAERLPREAGERKGHGDDLRQILIQGRSDSVLLVAS
jgi:hypothetical protein